MPFVDAVRLLAIGVLGVSSILELCLVIMKMRTRRIIEVAQLLVVEIDAAVLALLLLPRHVAFGEHGAAATATSNCIKQFFLFMDIVVRWLLVLGFVARRSIILLLSFSDTRSVLIIRGLGVSKLRREHIRANRKLAQLRRLGLVD